MVAEPAEVRPGSERPRRLRARGTVRARITAVATLVTAAVLTLAGFALVATQRRSLTASLDESLAQEARALGVAAAGPDLPAVLSPAGDDDAVAQVVAGDRVLAATANAAGAPPLAALPASSDHVVASTIDEAPGGDPGHAFRLVSRRVTGVAGAPGGTVGVHVAAPLDDIEESTRPLVRSLAVALPAVTLVLAWLVWWLVGRTLRPVEAMRRQAAGIGAVALDQRVPEPLGDDEIARLARTLNQMLGRIEGAALRQQRFVADASHDLRSPLARIRTELEVDLAHPDRADLAATTRSVLGETIAMQALVDDLLLLAREDSGRRRSAPHETVDLDEVVEREVRRARGNGRATIDARQTQPAQVVGDAGRLGRALGNVIDNAVRHAGSTVTIALSERNGAAVLTVSDDGSGIPPDRRDEVFERFARLDGARTAAGGGYGLGLAIARDIVEDHGGSIEVDDGPDRGARFVISLPLAPDGRSAP